MRKPHSRRDVGLGSRAGVLDGAFFRSVFAGLRNGALVVTRDGRLALINDEAYRILDLEPDPNDLGKPIADVLLPHPEVVRAFAGVFELDLLASRAELRLRPSGKVIGYTLSLVRDDQDRAVGATMLFKDLTRVEQLEERERLRDRLAAVGEMAAAIAHEVKNPLAGIEVMAGVLRRRIHEPADAQAVLTDIINEAKMANAIVQEVLEFVRPIRLHVERTPVADALQAALQLAGTQALRAAVDVTFDLPGDLPNIQADHQQLTQLFTNLLLNAFEAMDGQQGLVTIRAEETRLDNGIGGRPALRVEIADTGPGMTPAVADRVFDPFFTTKPKGSGLGLSIVRKIVDAHDGQIDLRTIVGRGTLVRVTLPVTSEQNLGDSHEIA